MKMTKIYQHESGNIDQIPNLEKNKIIADFKFKM